MNNKQARIFVAGHNGLVGSAIVRVLRGQGMSNIVTRSHAELELTDQAQVRDFFRSEHIDQVYLAAARVGGIHANNTYPAEFIYDNMMVAGQRDPRGVEERRAEAAVPRFVAASIRAWRRSRYARNT